MCREVGRQSDLASGCFPRIQRGVTSIEYALIAALIALGIIGGLSATGDNNQSLWAGWIDRVIAIISP